MDTSALAKRMKKYEAVSKNVLMRRTPVIIRVDGRAFHTFTKGFQKPFDEVLMSAMQDTMKYLCENIQGCVSRLLKKEYPQIRERLWKEAFWSQSFCLLTAGGAPIDVIRSYIETQGEKKR